VAVADRVGRGRAGGTGAAGGGATECGGRRQGAGRRGGRRRDRRHVTPRHSVGGGRVPRAAPRDTQGGGDDNENETRLGSTTVFKLATTTANKKRGTHAPPPRPRPTKKNTKAATLQTHGHARRKPKRKHNRSTVHRPLSMLRLWARVTGRQRRRRAPPRLAGTRRRAPHTPPADTAGSNCCGRRPATPSRSRCETRGHTPKR